MSEYKLAEEIIGRSVADTWDEAKLEWTLDEIYEVKEPRTCLCGHFPIVEICVLKNKVNGQRAVVGNCCVKKFMGLPSQKLFDAIKRVSADESKALNAETLEHAHRKGWINDWEHRFYCDTMRKRKPSDKQLAKRIQINRKVLAQLTKERTAPQ